MRTVILAFAVLALAFSSALRAMESSSRWFAMVVIAVRHPGAGIAEFKRAHLFGVHPGQHWTSIKSYAL
jgi:hypothetical protein